MRAFSSRSPVPLLMTVLLSLGGLALTSSGASAAVDPCQDTTALDINGDGYDDTVVGNPYATVDGKAEAGTIVILYGDRDGRIGEGKRLVIRQTIVDNANLNAGDRFGWSVAMDDVTGDGCADILVGSPGEDWKGKADAGIAHVLSFTPDGTGGPGSVRSFLLDQGDVGGTVEAGDQFGWSVAVSSRPGDDEGLVGVGAPGEDLGKAIDAGVVNTFGFNGVAFAVDQVAQGGRVPGTPESGDRFGASLVIAPLEVLDGTDPGVEPSFIAGAPGDTVRLADRTVVDGAGSVTAWDPVTGFDQLVTQDTAGVVGSPEAGDGFGSSVAFASQFAEAFFRGPIAIGTPGEDVGSVKDAGSVSVLESVRGTGLVGRYNFTQNSPGFSGVAEAGDRFGTSVAMCDGYDLSARLAIGSPYEDVGSVKDAGMVHTVVLEQEPDEIVLGPAYTENAKGTPGTVAAGNRFGLTLSQNEGVAEKILMVSSPYQGSGSVFVVDTRGGTRSWVPGRGGVPASSGRFGWSVAGLNAE